MNKYKKKYFVRLFTNCNHHNGGEKKCRWHGQTVWSGVFGDNDCLFKSHNSPVPVLLDKKTLLKFHLLDYTASAEMHSTSSSCKLPSESKYYDVSTKHFLTRYEFFILLLWTGNYDWRIFFC